MLGTTIIAAALATGDTMSQTIRSAAVAGLGRADEVVAARGVEAPLAPDSTGATGVRYFPQRDAARIARAAAPSGLVDGVAPVIVEPVAVQDLTSRQNEPRVALFAGDARSLEAFGPMRGQRGDGLAREPRAATRSSSIRRPPRASAPGAAIRCASSSGAPRRSCASRTSSATTAGVPPTKGF